MSFKGFAFTFFLGATICIAPVEPRAHCFSPEGTEGEFIYNDDEEQFQGCTDFAWYGWNDPGSGGGGCSGPVHAEGSMIYNGDFATFQGCNANGWFAFHDDPRSEPLAPCVNPAGNIGDIIYNNDNRVFQGCTPHGWYAFHRIPIETKDIASDGAASDAFGSSVSISGDVSIIGAFGDDDNGLSSGSAYIFRDTGGGTWIEEAKLTASDAAASDVFGFTVSISGDVAIVSAVNNDDNGSQSGSAYIFRHTGGGTWIEEAKLLASDGAAFDRFGQSVSIFGDAALIGNPFDDDDGAQSGSAYIFRHTGGGTWIEEAKLTASDAAAGDLYGASVSISGGIALIGAAYDDDNGGLSGSAYVFRDAGGGVWNEEIKLLASDGAANDQFGNSVSVSGSTALIGARYDEDNGSASGSAYIFRDTGGGTWTEEAKLLASDGAASDQFGQAVAISGDVAIVGVPDDDDDGSGSGSAYIFQNSGSGTWTQKAKITALDAAANSEFGFSVSISGGTALVGARYDDDNGGFSGSAYFYRPVP